MQNKKLDVNESLHLSINGMSCAGCVASVEKALTSVSGVEKVDVNFAEQSAMVYGNVAQDEIFKAVVLAGYEASPFPEDEQGDNVEQQQQLHVKKLIIKAVVAGSLGFPLMAITILGVLPPLSQGPVLWIIIGLLTSLVMWYSGRHFFIGAWTAVKRHDATMDTLIALGTGTAWLYSMLVVLFPSFVPVLAQHAYFETALIIISFINLGAALELRAKNKTSTAIKQLIGLQAKTARVIRDGKEIEIDIKEIGLGDTLRVRPGEKIAVDGLIIEGETTIDESMLTGEPIPLTKCIGDNVAAGTINGNSSFLFQSQRIGKDTLLSQIIEMVRRAQSSKPSIAKLVDKIAAVFVPVVMIISVVTFLVWYNYGTVVGGSETLSYAIVAAMTVLVIACPCALGLATPISIIVGVGKAAQNGILIRNGEALQRACKLDVIVIDKTGTITEGKPDVVAVHTADNVDVTELLQVAASVDVLSEHPLAAAIVENTRLQEIELLEVKNFKSVSGKGVTATISDDSIFVGNGLFISEQKININSFEQSVDELTIKGITPVFVARNQKLLGIIGIADPIKADSKDAVHRFIRKGLLVIMLSGDNLNTAHAVATQVGITQVIADVLPQDKAQHIEKLQSDGLQVGMVGDGINDAPALATAEVGFAIGTGTDIAIESADVTLMRGSLHGVADAIEISTATLGNIKQNLFGAFIYNVIGIPLAAGVFYPILGILLPPVYAGAAMAMSSFTVVSNANRLRWFKTGEK
ncbi:MAG: heavy metal translocating P-type ATPase [Thiohalomonadales bacterium]